MFTDLLDGQLSLFVEGTAWVSIQVVNSVLLKLALAL